MASRDSEGRPEIPEGLLATLIQELEGEDAPFVKHLDKELGLKWMDEDESRLGFTRFELDHHELYRRRRYACQYRSGTSVLYLGPYGGGLTMPGPV